MFPGYPSTSGSGKIVGKPRGDAIHHAIVQMGWNPLLEAMEAAGIMETPARIAAFLTTLVFESWCEFSVLQGGSNILTGLDPANPAKDYTGRGYIQLTGKANYLAAGKYLHIDLVTLPELAQTRQWSAKIATWYWTVARPSCNAYADELRMGKVNGAIGYPQSGSNDDDRCMVFRMALAYLTEAHPATVAVDCRR